MTKAHKDDKVIKRISLLSVLDHAQYQLFTFPCMQNNRTFLLLIITDSSDSDES